MKLGPIFVTVATAAAATVAGCESLHLALYRPPTLPDCPGELVPTGAIPGEFVWRERVRVVGGDVEATFDLVIEKHVDQLVLVGFNEFGAKAFSVVQRGTEVETLRHLGPATPVPPENILRDLHRARLGAPPGNATVEESAGRTEIDNPSCGYRATWVSAF